MKLEKLRTINSALGARRQGQRCHVRAAAHKRKAGGQALAASGLTGLTALAPLVPRTPLFAKRPLARSRSVCAPIAQRSPGLDGVAGGIAASVLELAALAYATPAVR